MKFICLDIETTGFDPKTNSVLEIAAVKYDLNGNIDTFHTFINFQENIPSLIKKLTSITETDVKNAPTLESQIPLLENFCENLPIMGHNIQFDLNFLNANGANLQNPKLDTMPLSHMVFEDIPSFSLEILCKTFNKEYLPSHRAINDVLANIELFRIICKKHSEIPKDDRNKILTLLKTNQNPEAKVYFNLFEFTFAKHTYKEVQNNTNSEIKPPTENTIFAVDQNKVSQLKNSREVLLNPNFYIDLDSVHSAINNSQSDFLSLLRILPKIHKHKKLHINHLNFRSDQFNQLSKFCKKDFEDLTQNSWICSLETLFEYKKHKQLPSQTPIEILDGPYLEESFLKSQENIIKASAFEKQNDSQQVTFIFYHLSKYLHSYLGLSPEQNYFGLLDRYGLTQKEFSDFIFELEKLELNQDLKYKVEQLKQHSKNGYVYLMLIDSNPPIIKSISYDLQVSKRHILEFLSGHQVKIIKSKSEQNFILQTHSLSVSQKDTEYINVLSETLFESLKDIDQKAVVICPSNDNIKQIYEQLCLKFQKLGIELLAQNQSGSKGKILSNLSDDNSSPQILLCTHHFFLKFNPDLHGCTKAILTKLPIGSPSHFYYKIKEQQAENSFIEIAIPNTGNNINHICESLAQQNINNLFCLDDRMDSTGWGKNIKRYLDKSIKFI